MSERSLLWPRPSPWHPCCASWVPGRGSPRRPHQQSPGPSSKRGGRGLSYSPARPGPLRERVWRLRAPACAAGCRAASRPSPSAAAASGPEEFSSGFCWKPPGRPERVPAPSRKLAPPSRQPARGNRGPKPTRRPPAHRSPAGPRAGRHSPQGLDGTCPVSLPSSGAAIRARLPAPPPPLSARWPGERQQVTRHLAKNTGSRRSAPARVRTLRPPPALQPASH